MVFNPDFLSYQAEGEPENQLLNYLQHQSPDVLSRVAKSASPEIQQIISQNVQGLVGMLPSEDFNVQITTDRENLAGLLASAMMTGYFLRQMEQRMELETTLSNSVPLRQKRRHGKKSTDSSKRTEE
jgi:CheY-specific phosphatase CheX